MHISHTYNIIGFIHTLDLPELAGTVISARNAKLCYLYNSAVVRFWPKKFNSLHFFDKLEICDPLTQTD